MGAPIGAQEQQGGLGQRALPDDDRPAEDYPRQRVRGDRRVLVDGQPRLGAGQHAAGSSGRTYLTGAVAIAGIPVVAPAVAHTLTRMIDRN